MPEQLKKILDKVVAWWKKFTMKQKALVGSLTAIVILALVILAVVMTKPTMVTLVTCEDVTEAASVKELLDGESISYEIQDDQLTFKINEKDKTAATYLLGTNKIATSDYSLDDVFDGSFSTTEADKTKKYQLYLEGKIVDLLENMDSIESATCKLYVPIDDGTILAKDEDTYASIGLKTKTEIDEETASGIAQFVATAVGDDNTDCITILDSNSKVLFAGGDDSSVVGTATSEQTVKAKAESMVKSEIKSVVLGTNLYDNVEVGLNLNLDFSKVNIVDHQYSVPDGLSQGYLKNESSYESETTGGTGGTPGTDSNGDTTSYVVNSGDNSTSTVTDTSKEHALNETVTTTDNAVGAIQYDQSSATVVMTQYVVYDEDTLKSQGTLKDQTFDEFVAANQERKELTVSDDMVTMIANATGFSADKISVKAYEVPFFQYSSSSGTGWKDYVQNALAVLILALLGYVVFRSTRAEKSVEMEPELSVESLLESTKTNQEELEDIGYNEKSETRLLIEKFVDEKPEAVASLLRNWLEEEWDD